MSDDQNARDDAIVLAALPGTKLDVWAKTRMPKEQRPSNLHRTFQRLERAKLIRYVRVAKRMKRWERVIEL